MSLWQRYRRRWQQYRADWLDKRIPPASQLRLDRHNLFIFPSRTGWIYLALCVAIFLLGSNYENNLVLALAYLLFSLFVVSIPYCHANLSGLHLEAVIPQAVCAGEPLRFQLRLHSGAQTRHDLQLTATGAVGEHLPALTDRDQLGVSFITGQRGWLRPGRLRLSSQWPLGLLECWTLLDLQQIGLVYPQPMLCDIQLQADDHAGAGTTNATAARQHGGMDEMQGLRPYRPGESLNQIAWKQVARGRGLVSKEFMTPVPAECWLELQKTPGVTLEERLSRLCYQVQQLAQQQVQYGLLLGPRRIAPGSGEAHQTACLTALALYENS